MNYLPHHDVKGPNTDEEQATMEEVSAEEVEEAMTALPRPIGRVLVCLGSPDETHTLVECFQQHGFWTHSVSDAQAAVDCAVTNNPHFVVFADNTPLGSPPSAVLTKRKKINFHPCSRRKNQRKKRAQFKVARDKEQRTLYELAYDIHDTTSGNDDQAAPFVILVQSPQPPSPYHDSWSPYHYTLTPPINLTELLVLMERVLFWNTSDTLSRYKL